MFEIYLLLEQDVGTLSAHIQNEWITQVLQILVLCFEILKLQESNISICKSFIVCKLVVLRGA